MAERIKYKIETETIQLPGAVEAHANEVTFINKSLPGVIVSIDGFPLAAGEGRTDTGNIYEYNTTRYNVTASAATFKLFVLRKIYQ